MTGIFAPILMFARPCLGGPFGAAIGELTVSVYGMLLIFFSPCHLEITTCSFSAVRSGFSFSCALAATAEATTSAMSQTNVFRCVLTGVLLRRRRAAVR